MEEPGWMQMFLLFMMLLQLPGVVSKDLNYTIRAGDGVMLSCENVIKGHRSCSSTTWIYPNPNKPGRAATEELVVHGQVRNSRSGRLSLAGNCSLVLKNVSPEEAGLYTCRQYETKGGSQSGSDAPVYLYVVTLTEQPDQNKVTLTCSVSTYDGCRHKVEWEFNGDDEEKDRAFVKTSSKSSCSAAVTFQTSTYFYSSRFKLFRCEVKTGNKREKDKEQCFTFSSGPTDKNPPTTTSMVPSGTKQSTTTSNPPTTTSMVPSGRRTDTTESAGESSATKQDFLWLYILVALVLLALIITAVAFVRRIKGKQMQQNSNYNTTSDPAAPPPAESRQKQVEAEEGLSYASISYAHKPTRAKGGDDGPTMTYSTLKASSAGPSSLYASIK